MSGVREFKVLQKKYIFLGAAVVIAGIMYFYIQQNSQFSTQGVNVDYKENSQVSRSNCIADDCLAVQDLNYPAGGLPENVKDSLEEAINDEYKALATYQKVIGKFGMVRPFSMIIRAEEQHIASLKAIYDKYGLKVPENTGMNEVFVPDTLQQACQVGVDAEIANAALYRDKLLPEVKDYEDITLVFTRLMNASQQKHLPAFDRCN